MVTPLRRRIVRSRPTPATKSRLPGQVVLVLQGGGALGAYQVGVYQALHEAGIEPVNERSGRMRYLDTREEHLGVGYVMASGALPPAFGALRIDGEPYWDGGLYSNTPIEAALDDQPRRDSLIFAVNVWHQSGPEPSSIQEVLSRTN